MTATSAMFHPADLAQATGDKPTGPIALVTDRSRAVKTFVAAFGSLGAGYCFAWLAVHDLWLHGTEPAVAAGFNAFALLFVMALAIERLLQPFVPALGPDTAVAKTKLRTAGSDQGKTDAQAELADARGKTAIVTWGVATALACLLSASLNVTLLHALTVSSPTAHAPYWADLLLTGLVVGAGTKPLNDLWSRLQTKQR